ncbi:predicted protein [Plenodomus lingam JN3]|uniref:Predicted protein n=1 Tax=Leptosphaeria maculans (strain JN3 / isolate v23.1.3 / race Av1-4-5-6-7-8) TaxID=985895 RepID=E4ZY03_LEPMJ|nr:predicted protein [Plenodomus lingam JN3]CBX96248.1 predicted protein [Plenodomus lingam JN3]
MIPGSVPNHTFSINAGSLLNHMVSLPMRFSLSSHVRAFRHFERRLRSCLFFHVCVFLFHVRAFHFQCPRRSCLFPCACLLPLSVSTSFLPLSTSTAVYTLVAREAASHRGCPAQYKTPSTPTTSLAPHFWPTHTFALSHCNHTLYTQISPAPSRFISMARLAAPPTSSSSLAHCSPLKIPAIMLMPIKSVSSTSTPVCRKLSMLPRPVLHQAATKSQIVRKPTGHQLASLASSSSKIPVYSKQSMLPRPVLHQAAKKTQIARKSTGHQLASPASSISAVILPSPRPDRGLTRLPTLVWPLTKPIEAARSPVAAPVKSSASRIPRRPIVKIARRKVVALVKPPTTSYHKRGSKVSWKPKARVTAKKGPKVVEAPSKSKAAAFLKRGTGAARYAAAPVKPTAAPVPKRARAAPVNPTAAAPSTAPIVPSVSGPKSAMRQRDTVRPTKTVQFMEGPFNTRVYSMEDSVEQLCEVFDSPYDLPEWWPLTNAIFKCPITRGPKGTKGMFQHTGYGPMTLQPHFLQRYAAVQRAEQLQSQAGERLGQLEYGNTDFKIALQANGVIQYEDIGTVMNAVDFSPSAPASMGRIVVFGRFPGSFQDVAIPSEMVFTDNSKTKRGVLVDRAGKLTRKQEGFGKPRAATAVMDMVWQRGGVSNFANLVNTHPESIDTNHPCTLAIHACGVHMFQPPHTIVSYRTALGRQSSSIRTPRSVPSPRADSNDKPGIQYGSAPGQKRHVPRSVGSYRYRDQSQDRIG